jgi:uncharacterized membrane protein HdeD (DUF308 family)
MLLPERALRRLADYWWTLPVRGVIAILFGLVAWIWPSLTVTVLAVLFGAWLLADGVLAIVSSFVNRDRLDSVWPFVISGVVNIIAGIVVLLWPGLSAMALMYFIAAWAIVTGVFAIVSAIQLRKRIENEWAIGFTGLLSIIFGVMTMIFPGTGAIALVWVIGIYAIIFGVGLIAAGFRLRNWRDDLRDAEGPAIRS